MGRGVYPLQNQRLMPLTLGLIAQAGQYQANGLAAKFVNQIVQL